MQKVRKPNNLITVSTQNQEVFIKSIKDLEPHLTQLGFLHLSTNKKGFATYAEYKSKDNIQALFMFGPSDWHVDLSLSRNERKYEFKDLLQIPAISQWTKDNKLKEQTNNRIKDEVAWFVGLLRFVNENKLLIK